MSNKFLFSIFVYTCVLGFVTAQDYCLKMTTTTGTTAPTTAGTTVPTTMGTTTAPSGCPTGQRACDNKQCIFAYLWCNGNVECTDGSDERNCPRVSPTQTCWVDQFPCGNGCLFCYLRCNGNIECPDGSDEENC